MLKKLSVDQLQVDGRKVFLRVDFNVPLDDRQQVTDHPRLQAALPTIRCLLDGGARLALASHLGRPKGKRIPEMSLRPVAARLAELLGRDVAFVGDCLGETASGAVEALAPGSLLLLENLRYHEGETSNDPDFSAGLAAGYDEYANDAFGTAHRAHASNVGITAHFPRAACGFLMKTEIDYRGTAVSDPRRPFWHAPAIAVGERRGAASTGGNLGQHLDRGGRHRRHNRGQSPGEAGDGRLVGQHR